VAKLALRPNANMTPSALIRIVLLLIQETSPTDTAKRCPSHALHVTWFQLQASVNRASAKQWFTCRHICLVGARSGVFMGVHAPKVAQKDR
jgi:hypothetical protein